MSDLRVVASVTPTRHTSDGNWINARGLRDGSIVMADLLMALAAEGRVFAANQGTVTTPIATAATTAIVAARPMAWVRVPDATAIIPIYQSLVVESTGATTQGEIAMGFTQNDVGNGTSTAGGTPVNLNAANTITSNCTTRRLATADVTAETNLVELTRYSFAASAVDQRFVWNVLDSGVFPILRGGATWLNYIGGNAVNFYITQVWAELPENFFS